MPKQGKLTRRGRQKLENRIEQRIKLVTRYSKQFAPVDTGNLMGSLHWRKTDWGWIVGTTVDYASFVEFGTRKMAAQPYLRPAAHKAFNQ